MTTDNPSTTAIRTENHRSIRQRGAVRDQFQQQQIGENHRNQLAIAADHGGLMVGEGMINGGADVTVAHRKTLRVFSDSFTTRDPKP